METTITITSLSGGSLADLKEDAEARLQKIESIKSEVAQEWDNINNPVPFLTEPLCA